MTKQTLNLRFNGHRHSAASGKRGYLYNSMRKHGIETFKIELIAEYQTKELCCMAEIEHIQQARDSGERLLNLAKGGEGGFVIPKETKEEWKQKLRAKRKNKKPALGMKHSDENKKKFSEVSREYWDNQETYKPEEVLKYGFAKSNKIFGISKTHYYRLRKQALNNEQC